MIRIRAYNLGAKVMKKMRKRKKKMHVFGLRMNERDVFVNSERIL